MPQFMFDQEKHEYSLNGIRLPSVTEICKPLTVEISENSKPWLRDMAAAKGTRVHDYCCDIDFNSGPDGMQIDNDCVGYVKAYIRFLRDYQIKSWLAVEIMVYSESLKLAGTIDRVGFLDGSLLILDIKTGAKIDIPQLTAQLMGYNHLLLTGDCNYKISADYDGTVVYGLQLKKDGNYRLIKCQKSDIFTLLHSVYRERERLLCKN